jgi:hypothetical protein
MQLSAIWMLGLLFAQGPADLFQKAPPDVDAALRERVTKFYQAHVDGKPRLADQYVAEDSKDYFFEIQKPRYKSFELSRILYSDNFTHAKVTVICGAEMLVPMGGISIPAKIPATTTWKQMDGVWYWYYQRSESVATPWGNMKQAPETKESSALPPPLLPKDKELEALASMIHLDKKRVELLADVKGSAEVSITHSMPGSVTLSLVNPHIPGLHAKLDRGVLKAKETAHLSIWYEPLAKGPKPPAVISLHVAPLDEIIPIRVEFTTPAKP